MREPLQPPAVLETPAVPLRQRLRRSHGVRSGVVLGVGTLLFSLAGYLFQTACIRWLGPSGYSDVATMLAITAVIAIPLGSVQTLIAREVAYLQAAGSTDQLRAFFRRTLKIATIGSLAVLTVALVVSVPIQHAANIESPAVVVAGLSAIGFLIVGALLLGFLQGAQRFRELATNYTVSGMAKPILVVPVLVAGLGAAGALTVNTIAAMAGVALALWALRDLWQRHGAGRVTAPLVFSRREVAVLVVGSLAFASLTNIDIVLASYYLDGDAAGIYAAAALVGKFVLLMPAAVVMVLLPKAASRAAAGLASERIVLMSAGVTLTLTLIVTGLLALVPESLLVAAFGSDFRDATSLLPWFGLAMTAAALLNVYLQVYLADRDFRFPLLVGAAAVAQVAIVAVWHDQPRDIVMTTLICCTAVMVVHELAFPYRASRIWATRRSG